MNLRLFVIESTALFMLMLCAGTTSAYGGDVDSGDTIAIKKAVTSWLCWDKYWGWGPYELGRLLPIKIKSDGKAFYVWVDDLVVMDQVRMAAFYEGRMKDGRAAVILREAYDLSGHPRASTKKKKKEGTFESGGPAVTGSSLPQQRSEMFDTGLVIHTDLAIPTDCTPHYEAATQEKDLMMKTIIKTIKDHLTFSLVKKGSANTTKLKMVIANFNVDYPSTYVLIEPGNTVYSVALHDAQDYDSHLFEREGAYPADVDEEPSAELVSRIKKNGIVKEINIQPLSK